MENNQINVTKSPVWKRITGLLVDTTLVFFISMTLLDYNGNGEALAGAIGGFIGSLIMGPLLTIFSLAQNSNSSETSVFIILIFYYIYCLLTELFFGKTLGKAILGLKIVSTKTGERANSGQIILRTFSRMIPFDPLSFLSKNPRGWHDSIARTSVIEK